MTTSQPVPVMQLVRKHTRGFSIAAIVLIVVAAVIAAGVGVVDDQAQWWVGFLKNTYSYLLGFGLGALGLSGAAKGLGYKA